MSVENKEMKGDSFFLLIKLEELLEDIPKV